MLQFTFGFAHSMSLKKCVMIYIHQIAIQCFHYSKNSLCSTFSFLPLRPFNGLHIFAFPECHIVGIIPYVASSDCLLSLSSILLKIFLVFWWFDISFNFSTKYSFIGRKWRRTKELDEGERGKWESWLQMKHSKNEDHDIWSHHFIENRERMERVTDFLSLGSKITAGGDFSHEINRRLLLGRKVLTNLDSILKGRDLTLPTKVHLVKAKVFPAVMYGCEVWSIKKTEHQRVNAFELWCWRRLLRVSWIARRSNQSILQEIIPE